MPEEPAVPAGVKAQEAVTAKEAVPNNEPVIVGAKSEPVTVRLPLKMEEPVILNPPWSTIRPFLTLNSFGIVYTVFTVQQRSVINIIIS